MKGGAIFLTIMAVEFLDEFTFGAREAAWPLIRDELTLSYVQIGVLLSPPSIVSNILEPIIGLAGDVWIRRHIILAGGLAMDFSLLLLVSGQSFFAVLAAFLIMYPASGAFVSLTQATLMDREPDKREKNMARWALSGSVGIVAGPLALSLLGYMEVSWRAIFTFCAAMIIVVALFGWKKTGENSRSAYKGFGGAARAMVAALKSRRVLRWLILLQCSDLMLDVFHGYLAPASLIPFGLGICASRFGLGTAMWLLLLGPIALVLILPKSRFASET